jgi:two-component system, LytTR family, response regulator
MNCIIMDDEHYALDLMEVNVLKVPYLNLIKKCANAFEAMDIMQSEKIDLIFSDIQMPGLSGIQFLKSLSANKPMVVFVTAYEKYALEGYSLDVIDYLVKPIDFTRFLKACNKAKDVFELKNQNEELKNALNTLTEQEKTAQNAVYTEGSSATNFFFVNADYSHVKVTIGDITHIEGMKDYIKIHLSTQPKPVITRMSIKNMEEKLGLIDFMRVHKSYVVARKKIESIHNQRIFIGRHVIPISDNFKDEMAKWVGE